MEQAVDKQVEDERIRVHLVRRSLLRGFVEADEDLTALVADLIGEDVRRISLLAQLHVELLRFLRPDKNE